MGKFPVLFFHLEIVNDQAEKRNRMLGKGHYPQPKGSERTSSQKRELIVRHDRFTPVISVVRRPRQKNHQKFKASLG